MIFIGLIYLGIRLIHLEIRLLTALLIRIIHYNFCTPYVVKITAPEILATNQRLKHTAGDRIHKPFSIRTNTPTTQLTPTLRI